MKKSVYEFLTDGANSAFSLRSLQALEGILERNRALRRAARGHDPLFLPAMLMQTRLLLDLAGGRKVTVKTLVNEVAPEWVSETTAWRIVRRMEAEGLVEIATDPDDGRARLVRPTAELLRRTVSLLQHFPPAPAVGSTTKELA